MKENLDDGGWSLGLGIGYREFALIFLDNWLDDDGLRFNLRVLLTDGTYDTRCDLENRITLDTHSFVILFGMYIYDLDHPFVSPSYDRLGLLVWSCFNVLCLSRVCHDRQSASGA